MFNYKSPNYVLSSDCHFSSGNFDSKVLYAGTFVRPIELKYVPQHVLDNPLWKGFNKDKEVFVYTRYGIIPVPKSSVREV